MTRVLVLGGSGMFGHQLWQVLRHQFDTWITLRSSYSAYRRDGLFEAERTLGSVDAADFESVSRAFSFAMPDVVVNAIGLVKQHPLAHNAVEAIAINALFPHKLASLCHATGSRLLHISTDCVFSGRKGRYVETDEADPVDLYGRTKLLGEVSEPHCLTLRTSVIGRELRTQYGLVEWFLANSESSVDGYRQAIYTGLTTRALACIVAEILEKQPTLSGIWHVSTQSVSKFDLLCMVRDAFGLQVRIRPDDRVVIDRSLNSDRFWKVMGCSAPTWPEMIKELANGATCDDSTRRRHAFGR